MTIKLPLIEVKNKCIREYHKLTWVKLRRYYEEIAFTKYLTYFATIPTIAGLLSYFDWIIPGGPQSWSMLFLYTGSVLIILSRSTYSIFCPNLVKRYHELKKPETSARLEKELIHTVKGYLDSVGKGGKKRAEPVVRKEILYIMQFLNSYTSTSYTSGNFKNPSITLLQSSDFSIKPEMLYKALEDVVAREENSQKSAMLICYLIGAMGGVFFLIEIMTKFYMGFIKLLSLATS